MGFYGNGGFCGLPFMNGFGGPMFMGLIFLAVIITAVWLIAGKRKENNKNSSAFEILQERLAKGEISPEEFRILRKELET